MPLVHTLSGGSDARGCALAAWFGTAEKILVAECSFMKLAELFWALTWSCGLISILTCCTSQSRDHVVRTSQEGSLRCPVCPCLFGEGLEGKGMLGQSTGRHVEDGGKMTMIWLSWNQGQGTWSAYQGHLGEPNIQRAELQETSNTVPPLIVIIDASIPLQPVAWSSNEMRCEDVLQLHMGSQIITIIIIMCCFIPQMFGARCWG